MITTDKITIGQTCFYYNNKAQLIETACASEIMNFKGEPAVCVVSQKDPVQLKYLYDVKPVQATTAVEIIKPEILLTKEIEVATGQDLVFKGKLGTDLVETIITKELIAEKSKPYFSLTITGVHDTKGVELVKDAKNKAVKMRTSLEKLEEPIAKKIKKAFEDAKTKLSDAITPLYDECRLLEADAKNKLDAWQLQVNQAKAKEDAELKEKTESREAKMFSLGMLYNGQAFTGHGKIFSKESLFALEQDRYDALVKELEGLKEEADLLPPAETPIATAFQGTPMYHSAPNTALDASYNSISANTNTYTKHTTKFGGQEIVYLKLTSLGSVIITKGQVPVNTEAEVLNDRILSSGYYLHITK